jgi:putative ABC transport system permease protein
MTFMLKNFLKTILRNLSRNKLLSLINITGLSAGLACCMLIILYAKDELSYDRFHKNQQSVYRLVHDEYGPDRKIVMQDGTSGMVPGPSFTREIPEIKESVRFQGERIPVKVGKEIFEQDGHYADSNFFTVFTFPLKAGNPATSLKDLYSVVLSEETAQKLFGNRNALGQTIELPLGKDRVFIPFTVTGIVPETPENSSMKLTIVLPMKLNERENGGDDQWINFYLHTFLVLHPGADIRKVEAKMKQVYEKNAKDQLREAREKFDFKNTFVYKLQPLPDMHLSTTYTAQNGLTGGSNPIYSKILGGIALFILVIACINFINLSVARSLKRAKEIGIRKVAGSSQRQLLVQFLGESFLMTAFAFLLALVLVQAILPFFNSVSNKMLSLSYLFDIKLVAGYLALLLLTTLLAGFYPAIVLSGFDPAVTLYNRMKLSGKNYLSKGLVILQFSLATFLIIATITIYSQFNYLTTRSLGYDDKNVLTFNTGHMDAGQVNTLRTELLKIPAVKSAAARQYGTWITVAKADGNQIDFDLEVIDDHFLDTYNIPIVKGRNFSPDFTGDSAISILINETFAKKAGWTDPINKEVDFFYRNQKYRVVGVVKDYHYSSLLEEIKPQLFTKDPQYRYGMMIVKIKPVQTAETVKKIESLFRQMRPLVPWSYEFKDLANQNQYASEKKWKQILAFSAVLTLVISCIGLFGLASLSAEKRTKEIGIRKVLGASIGSVANQLSLDFLRLVGVSALIALPLSWWAATKWLQNYPFRISMSPWIFAGAVTTVLLIALLTVSYQSIRAAAANPVKALRSE